MITTPVIKANQSNMIPAEVQMKLAIAQVLSLPFVYNSPVMVVDFEVGNGNVIKGRFKDASRPRIFEFTIDDSISFKPFTWKRIDSADTNPVAWEEFSKGYTYRYDAVKTTRKEKPKCGNTSYNCGKACIGLNKNCKSDPPDKPSQEKIDKVKAMAGGFKAVQGDPTKKQEDNKLTPKLQNREQGFRDKAREKVKGWQNKKVEPVKEQSGKIEIKGIETESKMKPVPELLVKRLEKKGFKKSEITIKTGTGETKIEAMARGDLAIHPNYRAEQWTGKQTDTIDGYAVTHIPNGLRFHTFKYGYREMDETLKQAENSAVEMTDLIKSVDLKNKDLNNEQLHAVKVGIVQAQYGMTKQGAEEEVNARDARDAKEKAEKLPLATEPKPKPEPKPIAEVKKPERFGDTAYDVDGNWIGFPGQEERDKKNAENKAKRKAFKADISSFVKQNKIEGVSIHQHGINTTPERLAGVTKILDNKGIEYKTDYSNVWDVKIKIKSLTPKKKTLAPK